MWIRFEATRVKRLPQFRDFRQALCWDSYHALGFLGFFWNTVVEVDETGDVSGWTPEYCAELLGLTTELAGKVWTALKATTFLRAREHSADGKELGLIVTGWVSHDLGGPLAADFLRGRYKDKGEQGRTRLEAIWAVHGQAYSWEAKRKAREDRFHGKTDSPTDSVTEELPKIKRIAERVERAEQSRVTPPTGGDRGEPPAAPAPQASPAKEPAEASQAALLPSPAPEPPLLVYPCAGTGAKEWHLTQAKVDEWTRAYPAVDVMAVCRNAHQWCINNPRQRKTAPRMAGWLCSVWLAKEQDRRGRVGASSSRAVRPADAPGRGNEYDQTVRS